MIRLSFQERPAIGQARGLLILHHGRGADENDLLPVADELDPRHAWHVVTPRAPLTLPGWPGHHWYAVPRVGHPDPQTFAESIQRLAELHDELWARTGLGPEQTVLGGFSMGTVMSYALGLDGRRPAPAGVLALSGFIPTVEGWTPSLSDREALRVFIAHGRLDQTIPVEFARLARQLLDEAGLSVEYHETAAGHYVDPEYLPAAVDWLAGAVAADGGGLG